MFWLWTRWGLEGARGAASGSDFKGPFTTASSAIQLFTQTFEAKTGVRWADRRAGAGVADKFVYTLLHADEADSAFSTAAAASTTNSSAASSPSRIPTTRRRKRSTSA